MTIPDIDYVIANRYSIILTYLLPVQNIMIFVLCTTPSSDIRQYQSKTCLWFSFYVGNDVIRIFYQYKIILIY